MFTWFRFIMCIVYVHTNVYQYCKQLFLLGSLLIRTDHTKSCRLRENFSFLLLKILSFFWSPSSIVWNYFLRIGLKSSLLKWYKFSIKSFDFFLFFNECDLDHFYWLLFFRNVWWCDVVVIERFSIIRISTMIDYGIS